MCDVVSPVPTLVLVVEPSADIRRMLAAAFRRWGVTGRFAGSGAEAVELCRKHGPAIDLALVEVSLPDMDGPAALKALRKIRPGLRCWFVGGTDGAYSKRQLTSFGVDGLLSKPFDLKSLRAILEPASRPAPRSMPGAERRSPGPTKKARAADGSSAARR
jgi:sigma-B regulation protein RsbU (phosphoserine phosphatase)